MEINAFIKKFAEAIDFENASLLTPDTKFQELEDWSSLSNMLVIAFINETFNKMVGDKDIRTAVTIQDLYNLAYSS